MCGIAGLVRRHGAVAETELLRMAAAIAHRGPDGQGVHVDGNVGLAHRRLAVIDTSPAGRQPMFSADGAVAVVYNGEIYNFRELRTRLEARGYAFRSRTDSEVVLAAYLLDGIEAVRGFNGMFAFALWDARVRRLYLVRDRYGIKPLYHARFGDTFSFGSEVRALLAGPGGRAEVNPEALNEYFTFQNLLGSHTLFAGVSLLPPATIAWLDVGEHGFGELRETRYWDYDFSRPDESLSLEDAEAETTRLFRQAVRRQLVSDVPVGCYLSGGMDSGSLTAVAAGELPGMAVFTCGFHLQDVAGVEREYDERADAEVMARHCGVEHYQQVLGPQDLQRSLPTVVRHLEDLRVGMSYPNYFAARLASRFVTVCLSGAGGDELFGGYPWRYFPVLGARSREQFVEQSFGFWERLVPAGDKAAFFQPAVRRRVDADAPFAAFRAAFAPEGSGPRAPEDNVYDALYFDARHFLHGLLLVGDRLAMASGLEERVPFLDDDLVAFAQRIPARHKLAGLDAVLRTLSAGGTTAGYRDSREGKYVLRRAMRHIVPAAVAERRKQGFSAPEEAWSRGPNLEFIRRTLLRPGAASAEYVDPAYVRAVLERHLAGENRRLLIWSLLCFETWCQTFLAGQPGAVADAREPAAAAGAAA